MGDMPLRFRGNGRGPAQSTAPQRGFGGRLREGAWSGCGGGEVFSLWLPLSGPRGRQGSRRCLCSNEAIICLRGGNVKGWVTLLKNPAVSPRIEQKNTPWKPLPTVCFFSYSHYSARLCTDPCRQSMETFIPSCRVRVAPMAPTMTALFRLSPTTAAWLPMPFSSVMTPMASRM